MNAQLNMNINISHWIDMAREKPSEFQRVWFFSKAIGVYLGTYHQESNLFASPLGIFGGTITAWMPAFDNGLTEWLSAGAETPQHDETVYVALGDGSLHYARYDAQANAFIRIQPFTRQHRQHALEDVTHWCRKPERPFA